jgi:hypothetical protein
MKMKRNILWLGMLVMVLAFGMTVVGCGSSSASTKKSEPVVSPSSVAVAPDIDYSMVGPDDSVILAYLDSQILAQTDIMAFTVVVNGSLVSPTMTVSHAIANLTRHSCQMQIPNGTHTLRVNFARGATRPVDELSFEADFDNEAITYKIRAATDEEKRAGSIGVGNEIYTLEEVARKKLR